MLEKSETLLRILQCASSETASSFVVKGDENRRWKIIRFSATIIIRD